MPKPPNFVCALFSQNHVLCQCCLQPMPDRRALYMNGDGTVPPQQCKSMSVFWGLRIYKFQMHWDSKILTNCPPQERPPTPLIRPIFHCRRGGLIKRGDYCVRINHYSSPQRISVSISTVKPVLRGHLCEKEESDL